MPPNSKALSTAIMPHGDSEQLRQWLRDAFAADHPAATIVLARRILEDEPECAATWARLGHALTELANFQEAETALRKALEFCSESRCATVFSKMGHLFHFRGDYETAVEWYRKVVAIDPNDAGGHIFLGAALARQCKLAEAETAHRAATRCPDGCIDEAYHNLGLVLRGQGRLEDARECFKKTLEIDPEDKGAQAALDDVVSVISYTMRI